MTTYPLAFPDVGVKSEIFSITNATTSSTSPFTGRDQVYAFPGQWWSGEISFVPTNPEDAGKIRAFLAALRGKYGTFTYTPDAAIDPLGAGGTIKVDGAGQTGRVLNLKDMSLSTKVAKAGDYFQLGTSLYQYTQDLDSDGSGDGVAYFEPAIRVSPSDGDDLIMSAPKGIFRGVENKSEWAKTQPNITDPIIFPFKEVIDG